MTCLKCGSQTEESQVFCNRCLEKMADRPVKPGTHLHLPIRKEQDIPKASRKRRRNSDVEEKLPRLKKALAIFIALSLLLAAALGLVIRQLYRTELELQDVRNTGKDYMVETIPTQ